MFLFPELLWYGYGSLVIYSDQMAACNNHTDTTQMLLMYTTYCLIIYTYAVYLMIVISFIAFLSAYRKFRLLAKVRSSRSRASSI